VPSRTRPPKDSTPRSRRTREKVGTPADAPRARARTTPADALPTTPATDEPTRRVTPAAARVEGPPTAGPARAGAAPGTRPVPKVRRTCYEVRLMVCPRDPARCPETWPVEGRVLCGSFEMLARFEKESGGEDFAPEAGLEDAEEQGLTITRRPDQDPEERDDEDIE
jgi:hypothetical protein